MKALDDLDDLAQFLLHKISLLNSGGSSVSKVDQVFETSLFELHNSLVSNYSLTLQVQIYRLFQNYKAVCMSGRVKYGCVRLLV